jgi:hypothetical protein
VSADGSKPTRWKQTERLTRVQHRGDLKAHGSQSARRTFVFRVAPEVIALPAWAHEQRVKDLDSSAEHVGLPVGCWPRCWHGWTERKAAIRPCCEWKPGVARSVGYSGSISWSSSAGRSMKALSMGAIGRVDLNA